MPKLVLTRGYEALIDEADVAEFAQFKWHAHNKGGFIYARRTLNDEGRTLYLHREIIRAEKGEIVDHINGDTLDCRRHNLRFVTPKQNAMNRKRRRDDPPFKGVRRSSPSSGRWHAQITIDGQRTYVGPFGSAEEAARAYDDLARIHFGAFSAVNFPRDGERGAC